MLFYRKPSVSKDASSERGSRNRVMLLNMQMSHDDQGQCVSNTTWYLWSIRTAVLLPKQFLKVHWVFYELKLILRLFGLVLIKPVSVTVWSTSLHNNLLLCHSCGGLFVSCWVKEKLKLILSHSL